MTNGRIVLIVEEGPFILNTMANHLKKSQFQVVSANSEEGAIERILDDFVDVVIAEQKLMEHNNELFDNLKSLPKADRPLVYVVTDTTAAEDEDEEGSPNLGFTRIMKKPLDAEKFCREIQLTLKNQAA